MNSRIDIISFYSNNLCYFTCLILHIFTGYSKGFYGDAKRKHKRG